MLRVAGLFSPQDGVDEFRQDQLLRFAGLGFAELRFFILISQTKKKKKT